jgi:hypothetical protein
LAQLTLATLFLHAQVVVLQQRQQQQVVLINQSIDRSINECCVC